MPLMLDLATALRPNEYPGRIVGCACLPGGEVIAFYAITGRSPASLDRHLIHTDDGNLTVVSNNNSDHDSLRHYAAAISDDRWIVVGNGEQVSEIHNLLLAGASPVLTVGGLQYEPDPPIYTPRITVVCDRQDPRDVVLAAARRSSRDREASDVTVTSARELAPGDVVYMTTYETVDGVVDTRGFYLEAHHSQLDASSLLHNIWNALPEPLRVAATVVNVGVDEPNYKVLNR